MWRRMMIVCLIWIALLPVAATAGEPIRLATFRADVTIPLGHRCMGVLPTKSSRIVSPLEARGFVLLSHAQPVVMVVFDWCEIRNDSYDAWRSYLAEAAGTTPQRVFLSCNHQHDAPVIDASAQRLLDKVGLQNELFDSAFQQRAMERVRAALIASLNQTQRVTHLGLGQAEVKHIASSRRVVHADGRVEYGRGSRSGRNPFYRDAPEGRVDTMLRTVSFWDENRPLLALHVYATHPMSFYGRGEVNWDFVGMARQRRQQDDPRVFQIYATGCSGDVTAGKYNDGSPAARQQLADRLYDGMVRSWKATRKLALEQPTFRNTTLQLPFHPAERLQEPALERALENPKLTVEARILAAMGLASRRRHAAGRPIDVPCLDFGSAQIVLLPGEAFVGYQLMAQQMRPDSFVVTLGYGECWPGYIPLDSDFKDGFRDKWLWAGPGSETAIRTALRKVLLPRGR